MCLWVSLLSGTLNIYLRFLNQVFFPHSQTMIDLLQALDVANRLDMVPQIWKGQFQLICLDLSHFLVLINEHVNVVREENLCF